jgi:hypothetical protein
MSVTDRNPLRCRGAQERSPQKQWHKRVLQKQISTCSEPLLLLLRTGNPAVSSRRNECNYHDSSISLRRITSRQICNTKEKADHCSMINWAKQNIRVSPKNIIKSKSIAHLIEWLVTGWTPRPRSQAEGKISTSQRPDRPWGLASLLPNEYLRVMRSVREADHSIAFSAEVKNGGAISPRPHGVVLYSL